VALPDLLSHPKRHPHLGSSDTYACATRPPPDDKLKAEAGKQIVRRVCCHSETFTNLCRIFLKKHQCASPESKWLLHKRSIVHSIQDHGGKRIRKLLKCIA
jgi:hypothetical protein